MQFEALALRSIKESHSVIGVINGTQYVLSPPHELIAGHNTRLQLCVIVGPAADSDMDRSLLLPERVVHNPLHAGFPILERRGDDHVADSQLLHYVAGLQHIPGPLFGFGASFQALDGKNHRGRPFRRRGIGGGELGTFR